MQPVNYQYGYDGADELLQATASVSGSQSPIDAYAYLYDGAGNRSTEQINNSVTTSAYNNLNQVTGRTGGGLLTISGSMSQPAMVMVAGGTPFITGSVGNTFSATVPVVTGSNNIQISATNVNGYGVTQTLGVNVTSGTPIPQLTYDANGNLTNDGTLNYVWDSANRLVQIWYGTVGSSNSTTMTYDGLGRRAQIVETGSNGVVTNTKNLVWDGMTIREEKNASDVVTKAYFDQGVQLGGSSNYYYTRDHLGSLREVTDVNANIQAEYAYDPYGRQTQISGTMPFDFGFTGQYYHQPSGLLLAPFREYSAGLGRWISRDPLDKAEMRQGPNLYEYALNDPVNGLDPDGRCVEAQKDDEAQASYYNQLAFENQNGREDVYQNYQNLANQAQNSAIDMGNRAYILSAADQSDYRSMVVNQYGINNPNLNNIMSFYANYYNDQDTLNFLAAQHPAAPPTLDANSVALMLLLPEAASVNTSPAEDTSVPQVTINRQNGLTFQQQVTSTLGATPTGPLTGTTLAGTPYTTIPDGQLPGGGPLLEVKNSQYVSYSPQLQAQVSIGQAPGGPGNMLVVNPQTTVSQPTITAFGHTALNPTIFTFDPITLKLSPY